MKLFPYAPLLGLLLTAALTAPAHALFEVKDPLSKMYGAGSKTVLAGTITALNPENHVLTVKRTAVYKGAAPDDETLQIQLVAPESLRQEAKVGQPVVIFQGLRSVAIHVADHWYAGESLAKPNQFRINTALGHAAHTSHDETFPGKTAALVRAVEELKAGKSTLLDVFPDKLFPPPQKEALSLHNATGFAVLQLGDKRINGVGGVAGDSPTFVVAIEGKVQAFRHDGSFGGLIDATEPLHLSGLKGASLAAARIHGKPALIIDKDVYLFDGTAFQKLATLKLPAEKIHGLAIDDLGDDGQPAVVLVTDKGLLRIPLTAALPAAQADPLATSRPAIEPPPALDDDTRLTGTKLTEYHRAHNPGFTSASLAVVDLNADQRPDLLLLTPEGTLTLLNRSFGGYLVNKDIAASLLDPSATGKPTLPLAAGMGTTLYLLHKDGTLYRYDFSAK